MTQYLLSVWGPDWEGNETYGYPDKASMEAAFAATGSETGALGYPTADEVPDGNGGRLLTLDFGKRLEVSVGPPGGERVVFRGVVSALEHRFADREAHELAVFADDFTRGVASLLETWEHMRCEHIYRTDPWHIMRAGARWLGSMMLMYRKNPVSLLDNQPLRAYNVAPSALLMNFKVVRFQFEPDVSSAMINLRLDPELRTRLVPLLVGWSDDPAFASALGSGVLLSALSVAVVQGSLTVLGVTLGEVVPEAHVAALTATGGLLLVGIALRLRQRDDDVRRAETAELMRRFDVRAPAPDTRAGALSHAW